MSKQFKPWQDVDAVCVTCGRLGEYLITDPAEAQAVVCSHHYEGSLDGVVSAHGFACAVPIKQTWSMFVDRLVGWPLRVWFRLRTS